jgi:phage terminase Nu1 subunit (DNA packaging protein)
VVDSRVRASWWGLGWAHHHMAGIVFSAERTAQIFGVNRRTVSEWLSAGCPAVKVAGEWRMNSAEVFSWLRKRHDNTGGGRSEEAGQLDLRERAARAKLAELKVEREERSVVDRAEVQAALARIGRLHAQGRMSAPAQWAPLLLGKVDLAEIETILRREMRETDERIAREIVAQYEGMVAADGDDVADL